MFGLILLKMAEWQLEMGRTSDYDIRPKPKAWTGSPTNAERSAKCCMLVWTSFAGDWWVLGNVV